MNKLIIIPILLILASCKSKSPDIPITFPPVLPPIPSPTPSPIPPNTNCYFGASKLPAIVKDGMYMIEGDIVLGPVKRGLSIPTTIQRMKWPTKTIPYVIHSSLVSDPRIKLALEHYHAHTGFRFVPRVSEKDYITFSPWQQRYCRSYIGRTGGEQKIDLGPSDVCNSHTVIHEIGHALGLWHEHTRPDRDSYIKLHPENIISGMESNIAKQTQCSEAIGPYDYASVMHYDPYSMSKNGKPIFTKPDGSTVGFSNPIGLSAGDLATLKRLYP